MSHNESRNPFMTPITRELLPRKAVLSLVGGKRRLAALEAAGKLHRVYPFGLKHARYRRTELKQVIDGLSADSS
jgi:hypothetical protein